MSKVLVIGDIHEPVCRKGYFKFNKDLAKKHKVDTIVFIGDLVDWHAISFHSHNPECPSSTDEYDLAFKKVQRWYRYFNTDRFKKIYVTLGNHDSRPKRLAESVQIPVSLLRDYNEQWKTEGWEWVTSVILDDVYYTHGYKKSGGINPAYNTARNMGMSVCMGHCHSRGGIKWIVNPLRRYFGMDVGCGIDDKAFAFAYAAEATNRSVLSSGVVLKGEPQHFMMPCGKGEKYHDSKFK